MRLSIVPADSESVEELRKLFNDGLETYNTGAMLMITKGGYLDVFERVEYESIHK